MKQFFALTALTSALMADGLSKSTGHRASQWRRGLRARFQPGLMQAKPV